MTLKLTDAIMGHRAFDANQIISRLDRPDAKDKAFLGALLALCDIAQIDPAVPVAQWLVETDNARSIRWNRDLNASGMGIVSDGTTQPFVIANVDQAARLFVQCLYALVNRAAHPGIALEADVERWFNRVWLPKVQSKAMPNVRTVADLGLRYSENGDSRATWSWEDGKVSQDTYGKKLIARLSEFYPNLPAPDPPVTTPSTPEEPAEGDTPMATVTFGRVPHPFYQDRIISNSTAWNDLGKRGAKCVVWHRMYGTLWGTDGYFRGEATNKALTDYGVGVAATDGAGQAGVILRWNDPLGRRAPWASGPVQNPIGDGAKFVNIYGINAVNRDGVSIEISGDGGTALDAKARAAVVALTAYFADQYGKVLAAKGKKFDYTTFPIIPDEDNRSFVCYHGEFYDGKRNSCPGAVVTAATDGMMKEITAILKEYQTGGVVVDPPSPPVYAKPQPPAAGDSIVNGRIFFAHAQEYTALQDVTPRIYADPGSDPTGPDIKKGAKVKTSHVVSDVGESADLTAVLEDGSRIPIAGVLVKEAA